VYAAVLEGFFDYATLITICLLRRVSPDSKFAVFKFGLQPLQEETFAISGVEHDVVDCGSTVILLGGSCVDL
jgi:hypothetical protein